MTARRELPPDLPAAFAVSAAVDLGVALHRLEAADLRRPFHGTRVPAEAPPSFETGCRALATKFRPGDAFTGPTAARIWGMPLPPRLLKSASLYVSSCVPTAPLRRAGVVGSVRSNGDSVRVSGVRVMPAWETCRSLAGMLTVEDLTAVVDFVVTGDRGRNPLSALADLDGFLEDCVGRPGVGMLRRAREFARFGAWSRPETHLRLLVMRSGLPEPALNVPLNHPSGRSLIPDLGWADYRVAAEYNGIHHEEPEQRVHDLRRVDDFLDIGWTTVNVDRAELFQHPESVVARMARRLTDRGWVPPHRFGSAKSSTW